MRAEGIGGEQAEALPVGSTVNGFVIEAVLGRGGFGITYLVRDRLRQRFALKECFPQQFALRDGPDVVPRNAGDEDSLADCRRRFLDEASALVRLGRAQGGDSHIVRIFRFFDANRTAYSVMEYLPGESLEDRLAAHPDGLPVADVDALLRGLLLGLRVVHDGGLTHRDVKPTNVLFRGAGHPVLIDFGSARLTQREGANTYTQIFSPGYAPIEQILGTEQGAFSDVYAVGVIGYRAIGGSVVRALPRHNAVLAGGTDPLPPARAIGAGRYSDDLLRALDAALVLQPEGRLASADAMLAVLDGAPVPACVTTLARAPHPPALPPPALPPHARAMRRVPPRWLAAGAAAVVLLAAAATLWPRPRPSQVAAVTPPPVAVAPALPPPVAPSVPPPAAVAPPPQAEPPPPAAPPPVAPPQPAVVGTIEPPVVAPATGMPPAAPPSRVEAPAAAPVAPAPVAAAPVTPAPVAAVPADLMQAELPQQAEPWGADMWSADLASIAGAPSHEPQPAPVAPAAMDPALRQSPAPQVAIAAAPPQDVPPAPAREPPRAPPPAPVAPPPAAQAPEPPPAEPQQRAAPSPSAPPGEPAVAPPIEPAGAPPAAVAAPAPDAPSHARPEPPPAPVAVASVPVVAPAPRVVLRALRPVEIRFRDPRTGDDRGPIITLVPGTVQPITPEQQELVLVVRAPERLEIQVDGRTIALPAPRLRVRREFPLDPDGLLSGAAFSAAPEGSTPRAQTPNAPAANGPASNGPGNSAAASRCRAISARAQIGEPLSAADLAFLRNGCRG